MNIWKKKYVHSTWLGQKRKICFFNDCIIFNTKLLKFHQGTEYSCVHETFNCAQNFMLAVQEGSLHVRKSIRPKFLNFPPSLPNWWYVNQLSSVSKIMSNFSFIIYIIDLQALDIYNNLQCSLVIWQVTCSSSFFRWNVD